MEHHNGAIYRPWMEYLDQDLVKRVQMESLDTKENRFRPLMERILGQ